MKVSTRGRYALRMMVDLASHAEGACVSLKDVAVRQEISAKYLEQIAGVLMKAGLLQSVRGAQGGYRLVRPACEYTAGEVLRALEGTLAPTACLARERQDCERADICVMLPFWEGLNHIITDYVDGITLQDIADGKKFV